VCGCTLGSPAACVLQGAGSVLTSGLPSTEVGRAIPVLWHTHSTVRERPGLFETLQCWCWLPADARVWDECWHCLG
jgi:hypothetical protein